MKGKKMTSRTMLAIIGICVLIIAVGVSTFWLGQKDTIKVTSEDKEIARITEKMIRGESLSPGEQRAWQKMQEEGLAIANELLKEYGSATPTPVASGPAKIPAGFKTGSWTENYVYMKRGFVNVVVYVADSAEGKIRTQRRFNEAVGYETIVFRNITQSQVRLILIATLTDIRGGVIDNLKINELLAPDKEYNLNIGAYSATDLKISVEVE